jgi:hypothetical protein
LEKAINKSAPRFKAVFIREKGGSKKGFQHLVVVLLLLVVVVVGTRVKKRF